MADEQNKQQGLQDQAKSHRRELQDPAGSVNTTDQSTTNPSPSGGIDPKNQQDPSKKDPSRQHDSTNRPDPEKADQNSRRRAS